MKANQNQKDFSVWPLWLCYGGMMCVAIGSNLVPVFLTSFSEAFGSGGVLSDEQMGRISAIMFVGFVTGILGGGPLADRFGPRPFTLGGILITTLGLLVLALAHSYVTLLISCFFLGLGAGVLDMVLSPIVVALCPDRRTAAMNWLHAFYCIGAVISVAFASACLHVGIGWRVITCMTAVLPVCVGIGFATLHLPRLIEEHQTRTPVTTLLRAPLFIAGLIMIFMAGAAEQGMAQWLPAYAERSLGYTKSQGGMSLAGFMLAMIVGRAIGAYISERLQGIMVLRSACIGFTILCLLGGFLPGSIIPLAACILCGVALGSLWPTTLGIVADRFPQGGASLFALLSASGNTGCILMPWIVGITAEQAGLHLAVASVSGSTLIILALLAIFGGHPHMNTRG